MEVMSASCNEHQSFLLHLSSLFWWSGSQVVMLERDSLSFLPCSGDASAAQDSPSSLSTQLSSHHLPDLSSVMEARRGVPQFKQPHVLLGRGLQELETLFPGFK
jgi:hypothetical protein